LTKNSKTIQKYSRLKASLYRVPLFFVCLIFASMWLVPVFVPNAANAAQLTVRSLTLQSAVPSATTQTWTFGFTSQTSAAIQGIKLVACTTAVGTYGLASTSAVTGCTVPTGININTGVLTPGTGWNTATAFTRSAAGSANCNPVVAGATNNVHCAFRAVAGSETAGARTMTLTLNTNPSSTNTAFFVGIYLYSDPTTYWVTPTDSGTVAAAIAAPLIVTATVQEILQFCVGASTVNDLTTSLTDLCSTAPGATNTVAMGDLDPTTPSVTPVTASAPNLGNNTNGIAIVRSNAQNGTNIYYDPVAAGSGSQHLTALRVASAACTAGGGINTDQCINSLGGSQLTVSGGTEAFGFTIAGVSCVKEMSYAGPPYSCAYGSASEHLAPISPYIGQVNTFGVTSGFAYNETAGSSYQIAQASAGNVVYDEGLIMKFVASPNIATPSGLYSISMDYIAVPSY
jgi:hypothetical protein